MKVYPIKYKDMKLGYLMALVDNKNIDREELTAILLSKLEALRLPELVKKWQKAKNNTLKELLEIALAQKIAKYSVICKYSSFSNLINKFLEKVTSFDAIIILMNSYDQDIKEYAYSKYHELLDLYLDALEEEDYDLYLNEGDDTTKCCKLVNFRR